MVSATLPTRPRSPLGPEPRPTIATVAALPSKLEDTALDTTPRSLSRSPPKINLNIEAVSQSTPRKRVTGGLALQARDSVAIRKRTMSAGVMSPRVARHYARKADIGLLQPTNKPGIPPSTTPRRRNQSPSNARAPGDLHVSRPLSSPPSQSPMSITPTHLPMSGGPSSYQKHDRAHAPHDSQGTTTSAYPPSSSISTRSSSLSSADSRAPSPLPLPKTPSIHDAPLASLDLDPDDVSARLRLLVNNSYFLPPAHAKPELSPIHPPTCDIKGTTSPNSFKEFFRVGKKREKTIFESGGHANEGPRHDPCGRLLRMPSNDSSKPPLTQNSNGRLCGLRQGDGYLDGTPEECTRTRVVVVRETVAGLPPVLPRSPLRPREYDAMDAVYNDPTIHYDVPSPTHFPSFAYLRIDAAGLAGNVEVDQFVPPGEPWSPTPSSPNGSGMDPQERVWRRAILEQAVDLSLSSSEAGVLEASSFMRGGRTDGKESPLAGLSPCLVTPATPKSPKSKRSWWGRKDKGTDDTQGRPSTSSSLTDRNGPRNSGSVRSARSLDVDAQSQSSLRSKREPIIGQRILPNVHIELEEIEYGEASPRKQENMGLLPSLRLTPFGPTGKTYSSAPVTPLSHYGLDDLGRPTILQPPPPRRTEKRWIGSGNDVSLEFIPGHSTIRKSLSSPLLSDLHEPGVNVERKVACLRESSDSLNGIAAPSLVLQDPSGTSPLVNTNSLYSFSSGSHYDDNQEFDGVMAPAGFPEDDNASLEQYALDSSPANGSGRPSLDSFGAERVRSPEYYPRTSSTFGFRRSPPSIVPPSPLWEPLQDIEADMTGDPTEHLSRLKRSSPAPSSESRISSAKGYVSALDYTITKSPSSRRPISSSTSSLRSTATKLATENPVQNEPEMESEVPIAFFDSIQHGSFMDEDGSSDSEDDNRSQLDTQPTAFSEHPPEASVAASPKSLPDHSFPAFSRPLEALPLSRKSMNSTRPTSVFTMQFRNASQPQLPVTRSDLPPIDTTFSHFASYDMLDRKKPLTNIPLSAHATSSGGILSHFKGKRNKPAVKPAAQFLGIGKKRSVASLVVLPEPTVESLCSAPGSVFPSSGMGTKTGSDVNSIGAVSSGFDAGMSQRSLLSMQGSDTASLRRMGSWRSAQDESVRKLDGMMTQHLEAERARLRKITSAVRIQGGARHRD